MQKLVCVKCNGRGKIPDMMERLLTFGISWLFDKLMPERQEEFWDECPACEGKGYTTIGGKR